ncbi:UNVERIFIED_CONTAM: hypothetical protein FKN15_022108 [Acipenser sinensis]
MKIKLEVQAKQLPNKQFTITGLFKKSTESGETLLPGHAQGLPAFYLPLSQGLRSSIRVRRYLPVNTEGRGPSLVSSVPRRGSRNGGSSKVLAGRRLDVQPVGVVRSAAGSGCEGSGRRGEGALGTPWSYRRLIPSFWLICHFGQ